MDWLRELVFHYLEEASRAEDKSPENLYVMADNFVKDVQRTISARLDFKGVS